MQKALRQNLCVCTLVWVAEGVVRQPAPDEQHTVKVLQNVWNNNARVADEICDALTRVKLSTDTRQAVFVCFLTRRLRGRTF